MPRTSAVLALALLASCAPESTTPVSADLHTQGRTLSPPTTDLLLVELSQEGLPELPTGTATHERARHALLQRQKALALRVDQLARTLPPGVRIERTYDHLPIVAVFAEDDRAADQIGNHPLVDTVSPEQILEAFDAESNALIGQPAAQAAGFIGEGTSVVVIDTGADFTHPDLGSCTAPGQGADCKVVYAADTAPDDGSLDDNGHGTNVSAIVAAIAPGADLIALDAFRGGSGYSSDILAALDWVVANQATYSIAAVNMSLGGGSFTSTCNDVYSSAIATVRSTGVSVVIATGNNAYTNAVASPACNADAISVGAVYDAPISGISFSSCADPSADTDQVTCFSNSASFVDVLAPGAMISGGGYTMAGTSQAAPHVAGVMAVLREAWPDATLDELEQLLVDGGDLITDHRNGLVFPRVNLETSVTGAPGSDGGPVDPPDPEPDPEPPPPVVTAASIVLDDGAIATKRTSAVATLEAPDALFYCLSTTDTCTTFRSMTDTVTARLARTEGEQTVNAWFLDANLDVIGPVSDTIIYDRTRPVEGSLHSSIGDGTVELSWSGFEDSVSGVQEYMLMQAAGTRAPTTCTRGTPVWTGSATGVLVSGLTNGDHYAFSVCAVDAAGNVSRAARAVGRPLPEQDAPIGSATIVSATGWTNQRQVPLALQATDASGGIEVCVTDRDTCRRWEPLVPTRLQNLRVSSGTASVNVWFRDVWGNTSAMHTTSVEVDRVRPENGTLTAQHGIGSATLSWSGFSDDASGLDSYAVYYADGRRAPRCDGTPLWTGTATTATVGNLPIGEHASFRVCAVDVAGNLSTGVTATVLPAAELDAPVGSITVEGGTGWTRFRQVYLEPSATDASDVTHVCLSHEDTCDDWDPLRSRMRWTLPPNEGVHTVNAWFKDEWGNVSAPTSVDVGYDRTDPSTGSLTVTPGNGAASLSWSGFSDAHSGPVTYSVHHWRRSSPPTRCSGTPLWTGTDTSVELSGFPEGTHAFRVCATDAAGNQDDGHAQVVSITAPLGTQSLFDAGHAVCSPEPSAMEWLDQLLLDTEYGTSW